MKHWIFCIVMILSGSLAASQPNAQELLAQSDRARGAAAGTMGLTWVANVTVQENGVKNEILYEIKVRGDDALAIAKAPPRQKGETILFNDRVLWFVKPGLKKPVSVSARQRLVGQMSNGDIASTRYARDYEPSFDGDENVNGQPAWRLELKAKAKNVTYDRIRYWVTKKDFLAVKADFLTLEGKVFKSATFEYRSVLAVAGKKVPFVSEMRIVDAAKSENYSLIKYQEPREVQLSASEFNVNNLLR